MHEVLGVILAGGAGRRMGADKALVPVGGVPMVERVARAMREVADDRPARRGPLAGLATALRVAEGRQVLLVAVDQPLVRAATLRELAQLAAPGAAVVPVDGGARQVTCAVYPAAWAAPAEAEDEADGSIQSLLDRLPVREVARQEWARWGEDGRSWLSVDDDAALARAEELLAGD